MLINSAERVQDSQSLDVYKYTRTIACTHCTHLHLYVSEVDTKLFHYMLLVRSPYSQDDTTNIEVVHRRIYHMSVNFP